jgi:hypothetical protein
LLGVQLTETAGRTVKWWNRDGLSYVEPVAL